MADSLNNEFELLAEDMIDKHGLASVLGSLAFLCYTKADHIELNWQDVPLARRWNKAGTLLDRLAEKLPADV